MENKYTLDSIAGYEAEKEELKKIIDLFKNYDNYIEKGAYLSKGLILSGDPGVGKTLFAKVLASEIDAPIIILDGAELSGIFGAYKIKKAFKKASLKTPSMIFIDELNLFVGDDGYYSDFTQRNLSCLLKLIDGIKDNKDIIVVGASSSKDELDEALLRSGRMDKHICIGLPDNNTRRKIFEYYLNKVSLNTSDLDMRKIVDLTSGLTGADIKTIVNEAALEAINNQLDELDTDIVSSAITKVINKDINRGNIVNEGYVYHDIGHLIALHSLFGVIADINTFDKNYVGNSTIDLLDDGSSDLKPDNDYDYDDEDDEDDFEEDSEVRIPMTKNNALPLLAVKLAGMALEEVYLNDKSIICYTDINDAVNNVNYMLGAGFFGFKYAGMHLSSKETPLSGKIRGSIDLKIEEILNEAYELAKDVISKNVDKIEELFKLYKEYGEITKEFSKHILTK